MQDRKQVDLGPVFAEDGVLARAVPGFRHRPQQLEFANAVLEAIEQGGVLVAEAGTGTGKTFAYLVPALLAGGRVIISTGTKTLQDQLFHRDLPRIISRPRPSRAPSRRARMWRTSTRSGASPRAP